MITVPTIEFLSIMKIDKSIIKLQHFNNHTSVIYFTFINLSAHYKINDFQINYKSFLFFNIHEFFKRRNSAFEIFF